MKRSLLSSQGSFIVTYMCSNSPTSVYKSAKCLTRKTHSSAGRQSLSRPRVAVKHSHKGNAFRLLGPEKSERKKHDVTNMQQRHYQSISNVFSHLVLAYQLQIKISTRGSSRSPISMPLTGGCVALHNVGRAHATISRPSYCFLSRH